MKKFKPLSLLLLISMFLCLLPVQALALDMPEVAASSAILMNADTGEIFFDKSSATRFQSAHLATLMSAIVVANALDTQTISATDAVTASENIYYNMGEGSYSSGIAVGEVMTVDDLLYCGVLASAGEAWNVLAEHTSGSVDAFVAAMNARAQELGCTDTFFVNANGEYAEGQTTSVRDLALIAKALAETPTAQTVYSAPSHTVPANNVAGTRDLTNYNALLDPESSFYYGYAYGFKSDYIEGMGYALVSAATYNDLDVIAVVVGSPDSDTQYTDTKTLLDWTFSNYGYRTLLSSTDIVDTLTVSMGNPDSVSVRPSESIQVILPGDRDMSGLDLQIEYEHDRTGSALEAPIAVGDYLGDVTVYLDGEIQGTSRLVAATAVDISRVEYLRNQLYVLIQNPSVRQIVGILLAALGIYLLLVIVYTIQRVVHLFSLRKARKARAVNRARQELGWLDIPDMEQPVDYLPDEGQDMYYDGQPEDYAPADDGAPVEEAAPAEGDVPADDGAPDDGEVPAEDDTYYEDEDEGGEYYEDEGEYADDDYYEDEGPDEPPAKPKRRWGRRK